MKLSNKLTAIGVVKSNYISQLGKCELGKELNIPGTLSSNVANQINRSIEEKCLELPDTITYANLKELNRYQSKRFLVKIKQHKWRIEVYEVMNQVKRNGKKIEERKLLAVVAHIGELDTTKAIKHDRRCGNNHITAIRKAMAK